MIDRLRQQYMHQPHEVSIETLALCNAACTFCPYPTLDRKGAKMPDAVLYDLLTQMEAWTEPFFISPFKVNEPLLDARLQAVCERIATHIPQARIRLFTNGHPLTERHLDWIAGLPRGRLEHLWISLNSTDPTEYGELMKCSYSMIHDRLHALHARLRRGTFPHPVVVSRVVQGEGTAYTPAARLLHERDVTFHRDVLKRWPCFHSVLIKRDAWLGYVTASDPRVPNTACARWFELNITAEGKVVQCCMDGQGEYVYGDVTQCSLSDVYNSLAYRAFRERTSRRGIEPCSQCSY
jgi:sulfatase maturation enzyme AslB (radical SAM superfamily)